MKFPAKTCLTLLLLLVAGCGTINLVNKSVDAEMESFVRKAIETTGTELTQMRENDPSAYAWDDVPLEELPDHERAEKEMQRAKYFSIEVNVEGELWNVSYRRFGNEWMLNNVSTALINPRPEILLGSITHDPFTNISTHPVFKHFIPPNHEAAKKAHDAIRKRIKK